jgi:Txe/YoeB family toxin of Txe-Axe toxin-antitoxin module
MYKITFTNSALIQFEEWIKINPRIAGKILKLVKKSAKNPYSGNVHPERLKHEL